MDVGASADTPEFAVTAMAHCWEQSGRAAYPQAPQLLLLADAGGSHGCRPRVWKEPLPSQVSAGLSLSVTVCHDPTGGSQGNPLEHRLFGQISLNGAAQPVRTCEPMLGYVRETTTTTGLRVIASLLEGVDHTGKRVADAIMKALPVEHHPVCPPWHYTIHPRRESARAT